MSLYATINALMTPGLTPNESRVYAYLVGRGNGAKVCWPTVDDIAADLKMSRRAVIDATTELNGHPADSKKKIPFRPKLIDVKRRYRQSNDYVVVDVPGLHDKPLYAGSRKPSPGPFSWNEDIIEEASENHIADEVQITAHVSPDSGVQIPAHVPEISPLECKILHSEVQITAPESVQQESNKEERTLLRNGDADKPPAVIAPEQNIRKLVWEEGKAILRQLTGKLDGQARKQIGAFLREARGDCSAVLGVLRAAAREGPYEPIPWIVGGIQARVGHATKLSTHEQIRREGNLPSFLGAFAPLPEPNEVAPLQIGGGR